MNSVRDVIEILPAKPTREGAGVRLKRAVGYDQVPRFDPFLLLDDIHSADPRDYVAGFPWHPHRGIETVTYVVKGLVEHGDSIGNRGTIGSGDVQWMTAGSGIVHQEMPQARRGDWRGLQLWVNLPASHKMMPPRYRDVLRDSIPEVEGDPGATVKVIAGRYRGTVGPVHDIVRPPEYLDVSVSPGAEFRHGIDSGHTAFAYMLGGAGAFGPGDGTEVEGDRVVRFGAEGKVVARAGARGLRFLLVSGEPLNEPVAWRGPIVMNTEEELDQAFREYREGTFLR